MSERFVGPYRLVDRLGQRSRHQVYLAEHRDTGERYALKLVNITSKVDREFAMKRIRLEARILKRLDHPSLVRIIDADVADQQLYFVMENVDGEPLSALLARRGLLAWDRAVDIARQIAQALEYLHEQELLHLKLTPDKILVMPDGRVKLSDMRINRARKRRWDDAGSRVLDTAAYLAPEQLAGEQVTAKCDLYSLGVVLFEMIAGKLPFEPDTLPRLIQRERHLNPKSLSELVPDCPVWVDRLVTQMLSGDPVRRPHSMHAVVISLQEVQKMEATGMGVAQRMAKGFNPLTAGKDSREAKRLLGIEDETEAREPRDYSMVLLAASLALVVAAILGGLVWALMPPSEAQLFARAQRMMENEDMISVASAKQDYLVPLLERYPDGEHAEEARRMLDVAPRKLAAHRMRINYNLAREPRSEGDRANLAGWLREEDGKLEEAFWAYAEAAESIPLEGDDRGAALFARFKVDELRAQPRDDPLAAERITGHELEIRGLIDAGQPLSARQRIEQVVALYGDHPPLAEALAGILALRDTPGPPSENGAGTRGQDSPPQSGGES